jgi:hypothetical protein
MARESSLFDNLSAQEKILLARGGSLDAHGPRLEVLISLAGDSSEEISKAARETLARLPDSEYERLLSEPVIASTVAQYFLNPEHLRPALLPVLLQHPAIPQEALVALARNAGHELFAHFVAHLELLKSPVLTALKENRVYVERQRAAYASGRAMPWAGPLDPIRDHERMEAQKQLAALVAVAKDSEGDERKTALETLAKTPDGDLLNALAASSLDETLARYFLAPGHLRPALVPLLLGHPDTPPDVVVQLASAAGPDIVPILLDELDLMKTPALIALKENPTYLLWQKQPPLAQGYVLEVDLLDLLIQEMEAEKPPTVEELEEALSDIDVTTGGDPEKLGLVKKISRMKVAQRVKLALLGTREERSMLIRDTSRVVYRAVLGSPKMTESEVEGFAALKNVSQEVLRLISMSRRFMKDYTVLKNLACNPRTPIDVSLPLLNRLLPNDLRLVAGSRDVPETLRKMAQKLIRSRTPAAPY